MGIELVTGFTGKAHISSLDVAKFNAGAFGPGEYVFAGVKDDKLKATMASSNKVHISSGNAMMQGRHFWVDAAGVDLTVQTGTQGQKRNDLVVARYAKNASTGIESVSLVVIKGTPTTGTPADPSYTRGDILNGNALANDMPLWRIPLNGITVGTPVQLFKEFTSAKDAWDSVSQRELIWSGAFFMRATQSIQIPKGVNAYSTGIMLVWSAYADGVAQDYNFHSFIVPKEVVSSHNGFGHNFFLATQWFSSFADKYVYINENSLVGHEGNDASGTGASGVVYDNRAFVLREVWGV